MPRILIVDDDRQMVRTICDILKLKGWDADGAFSGEEALDLVQERPYRVALMDVRMAGMNGVEAMAFHPVPAYAPAFLHFAF